jgi:cyclic beta-1,2-glucan synthetase
MSTTQAAPATPVEERVGRPEPSFIDPAGTEPIRAELYGLETLEAQARRLADASPVLPGVRAGHPLLTRFMANGRRLARAYEMIREASRQEEVVTPDAEWLLDNYHIVADALREVRHDLPRGYYKKLPKVASGPFAGYPRVYPLALELIAHTDSSLDEQNITRFVKAYQTVRPLLIGELWAVPIMLRLGLLENLTRLAEQMLAAQEHRREAAHYAACLIADCERYRQPQNRPSLTDIVRPRANWSDAFALWLLQGVREHGAEASWLVEWLEQHFAGRGMQPPEVVAREHTRQAANQVSVGNCVTSLRLLSALDWTVFFEHTSLVEELLGQDPAGVYTQQDFPTKDRYRRTVEKLARSSGLDELEVTRCALGLAGRPSEITRERHVGTYLLGRGRPHLEAATGYRPRLLDRLREAVTGHPGVVYFGGLALISVLILAGVWMFLRGDLVVVVVLLLAAQIPMSELAVGLLHYAITVFLPPRVLPKLDFKEGIPPDCPTFIVMPTMLIRPESAAVLTDRLEVHYLSNPDPELRYALLTDFADAPTQHMSEDEEYVRAALERIKTLNERYCADGPERFFLFHRRRVWDPAQGCWMGWERKRGKLVEFNRLLRGAQDTNFVTTSTDPTALPHIRFVITLDADTQLPREAAQRLVGTLAHPLNQPHFDAARGLVVEGYGVLQPRVSLSLVAAARSLFASILTGSAGIDPYTTAVSDVYQDLFGVGTFTGKGIYDVNAFEAAVGHTFPDDYILSHDLIEGNYARCGLVTDIELLDEFPARYHAYARREHRWVRGDWQLLPWLLWRVPVPADPAGGKPGIAWRPNPLPLLARWKIFDNLRRSLVPPFLVLLLVLGWTLPDGSPWFWTGLAAGVVGLPLVLVLLGGLFNLLRGGSWKLSFRDLFYSVRSTGGQVFLALVFLAEQARLGVDAIVRTLVRRTVTRRNLLEWETAAAVERRLGTGFVHFCLTMWPAPNLAVLCTLLVWYVRPEALAAAGPILAAWFLSPAVAFWVSQPRPAVEAPLNAAERRELRRLARKTWGFFETFVSADDHGLPPDNYQEDPKGAVAHRTSPTNIGLYLLSSLAAHDFGYLGLSGLLGRLEKAFDTLDRLERYRGHFYNWYDTATLRALEPRYVSTVDSGNLAGCLVALKQGLRELVEEPLAGPGLRDGLADALRLVAEELRALEPPAGEGTEAFRALERDLLELEVRIGQNPTDLPGWQEWLLTLGRLAGELTRHIDALGGVLQEMPGGLALWARRFAAQVRGAREDLEGAAPWLGLLGMQTTPGASPEADGRWQPLRKRLTGVESLADLPLLTEAALRELSGPEPAAPAEHLEALAAALQSSTAADLLGRCARLAERATAVAQEMDFSLLYNDSRYLFAIGYNLSQKRLDNAHYDLLASEASLTSFLAVARGDAPKKHWFQLGRPLTRAASGIALVSWGGTMFEYLMPRLLLRSYASTLGDESCRSAVARQIEYGREQHVPWGISESAYSAVDAGLDYQYQSFGVPGLGLKRGLADNLVIAPYATALALLVRPRAALENFRALRTEKAEGAYGFYEAVDYTRDRRIERRRPAVVRCFMAHHQGMSLLALANCLLGEPMIRRFHSESMVRATELLLQERVPRSAPLEAPHQQETAARPAREHVFPMSRRVATPQTPTPRTHLLSNGRYSVLITNAGGSYSTWRGLDVTRWREDRTRDCWGQFCYVRDLRSGLLWSVGHQPLERPADAYEVVFSADKAEIRRFDGGIETHLEIAVSPENAAEVRRLTFTNDNARTQELEVTTYTEVVLQGHGADLAHPAFGKLFLETEFLPGVQALLCRRRPRSAEQKPIWAVHVLAAEAPADQTEQPDSDVQYETDRARFLGRGRTPADPAALVPGTALGGTTGSVLDPVFSLRRRVRVPAGGSMVIAFSTAVAETREEALALADQYHDLHGVNRAFELAWAHAQVELRHLRLTAEEVHLYQRLAAHIFYAGPALRVPAALAANRQGQAALWRHGISGDLPIVLVRLGAADELPLVRQVLLAHTYWRSKGLAVELVILNEHPASYLEVLHEQALAVVRSSEAHGLVDKPGGVFLRKGAQIAEEDRILLQAAARVVLVGGRGSLAAQVERADRPQALPERLTPSEGRQVEEGGDLAARLEKERPRLLFANGFGGFSSYGREYWIVPEQRADEPAGGGTPVRWRFSRPRRSDQDARSVATLPPAPWINVIANPSCGCLVSEGGLGYTWVGNSQSYRLTPWSNDPVSDPPGEVVYVRDDATGAYWTPTPLPLGGGSVQLVRHGQGYTVFEQDGHGLVQELLVFVPVEDPVKLIRLSVRNPGRRTRRLSAAFYAEWVLGSVRDLAALQVVPSFHPDGGMLVARNAFNMDYGSRLAFVALGGGPRTFTADRTEFLGRNGSVSAPAALGRVELSGRAEPGLDPCAAFLVPFNLEPGEKKELVFVLGEGESIEEIRRLVERYRDPRRVQEAFDTVCRRWDQILNAVQVRTPEPAMDLLLNRWLLYQVLSCRVWARSAFYQSGGAYGFRDQLQDVMALAHAAPAEERAQLLRAAGRQFLEGDVQHWWHTPAGRGVRTHFSDDLLWLPLVACHYVATTADLAVLDVRVPFVRGPVLGPGQEEDYGQPEVTEETATLYEHCVRALEHGYRLGPHGLPLMGTGDWNDGMNRVGAGGRGESVWNAWFLITILNRFAQVAEQRSDAARAAWCQERAERLRAAAEEYAWDGHWYRRAYFDDGTPLGSAENDECQIDSIAQTWAVICGAAEPGRVRQAMAAVDERLVRPADRLILLFTPPFDKGSLEPGYIKGYVPGIRENGGQYTHAATWVVEAAALLGRGNRAGELFRLLNPILHADKPEAVARYHVEPYVIAADVYGQPPHTGRGGWTWYTGSAGWFYRIGLERILGFQREGNRLKLEPCIPAAWRAYEVTYRHGTATYVIHVENPQSVEQGVVHMTVDGREVPEGMLELADDGAAHEVRVVLGKPR